MAKPTVISLTTSTVKQLVSSPFIKISISAFLLWLVFRNVDLSEIGAKIMAANPVYAAAYLAGSVGLAWLAAWRWSLLVFKQPALSEINAFFKATMLGLFYSLFMPSSVGGDALKWTALNHLEISKQKLIFTMLLDRVMGMLALVMIGFLTMIVTSSQGVATIPQPVWYLFSALFLGMLGFFGFVFSPISFKHFPILNRIEKLAKIEEYLEAHKPQFAKVFGLGLVVQFLAYVLTYFLGKAVGLSTPLYQFMMIGPVVGLITTLPVSFAGFGATEVAYLYFFGQLGETQTVILAMTSLGAVFRFVLGFLGWLMGVASKD